MAPGPSEGQGPDAEAPEGPAEPEEAPPRLEPLGAHNDLMRPGGRLQPLPPDAPAPPPQRGSVGLGVALAFGWVVVLVYGFGYLMGSGVRQVLGGLLVYGSLVAIHVYALANRKGRILLGFWTTLALLILAFVVTCFATLYAAFG